jgi:hypothetical protein
MQTMASMVSMEPMASMEHMEHIAEIDSALRELAGMANVEIVEGMTSDEILEKVLHSKLADTLHVTSENVKEEEQEKEEEESEEKQVDEEQEEKESEEKQVDEEQEEEESDDESDDEFDTTKTYEFSYENHKLSLSQYTYKGSKRILVNGFDFSREDFMHILDDLNSSERASFWESELMIPMVLGFLGLLSLALWLSILQNNLRNL